MESTRQQKYGKLILKELGYIFLHDTKNLFGSAFITVTTVRMTPDLGMAKVYLSFMMVDNKEELLNKIINNSSQIRKALGNRIGKQVRVIPSLSFFIDDSIDYAMKMNELFSKIEIPKEEGNEKENEE